MEDDTQPIELWTVPSLSWFLHRDALMNSGWYPHEIYNLLGKHTCIEYMTLTTLYPLVMTNIAIENHHRNSGFFHWTWWIFPVRYVSHYQRVTLRFSPSLQYHRCSKQDAFFSWHRWSQDAQVLPFWSRFSANQPAETSGIFQFDTIRGSYLLVI